ncbi:MAG: type II toxin-antitoxin system MqsR family toxin [Deltaproteobacteria bacterium]|nr:type II toxin-antitoxin system MqsR family toxin [Deltaproteobacteria bacterium]
MEKRKPAYSLAAIQKAFNGVNSLGLATTASAFRGAQEAGLSRDDMITVIQSLRVTDFIKSMTAYGDAHHWQDVYHARIHNLALYVKFTQQPDGTYVLLSCKEK